MNELKSEYSKDLELKNSLDNKANSTMTATITSSSLIITILTFLISRVETLNILFQILVVLFGIGLALIIVTMIYSFKAYKIRDYRFAIKRKIFFKDDELDDKKIDEKINRENRKLVKDRIKDYLKCLNHNTELNNLRAVFIQRSQIFFIIGEGLLVALLILLVSATTLGWISIKPL